MAEEGVVQGNTESTSDAGVYTDTTQQGQTDAPINPGIEAATKAAAETLIPEQPFKYDFKPHEGAGLDQEALDSFTNIMQELKVNPETAQKILDIQAGIESRRKDSHEQAVEKARNSWVENITKDPELGGEKLQESLHIANQGLDKIATDGFKELLRETGLGDHPEVIRVFHNLGKLFADDTVVVGGPQRSIGKFYENSPDLK